ncbi:IPT/TIG domain-containing protein [Janthinobacterium sp. LB2P49]|uniref:IPT/TIG domain-containing protein n=1 Tax=Janthinobacterium sp. LB2P49 TaxID=3424198 RepID=UPI003F22218A
MSRLESSSIKLFAWLCLLTLALGVSPAQAAGPSTECPPNQSFTVAAGGNHTIDLSGCTPFGFTGMPVPPSHGSIPNVAGNGTGIVVYTNNSDGATSDTFTLSDDLAGDIVFVVTILPPTSPITVTPASLPAPVIGVSYNQTISSTGGIAPYAYTLSSLLPAGMSLSSAGLISGTPTATGVFVFGAQITDSTTPTALTTTKNYSFTVAAPVLAITPASPAAGAVSQAYSQQFSTSGGTSGYTYVVESGTLPTGLSLSASGLLSGTPTGTGTFNFVLKSTDSTGGGGPYAKTISISLTINALPIPTVSSISPTTGPTTGGTSVIITGTNLTGATAVRFGATNATGFTVNSATQITATAPAGTGTIDVRVTTSGGTSATSAADQFTYLAAPTVSSISPTAGPATGGTTVIISGTNFSGATAVTFGATAATGFTVNSATQITATAPAGSGTVDVRVTTGGGTSATSAADQYTYIAAPTVGSISPTSGPATGGTSVIITGTNLTGATAVRFGAGNATGFTVNSATQITATAPAGTGTVDITVITGGGTSATSAADQYTYVAAPTVSSISPTSGPTTGGTSVTINGTNFVGVTAVTFGGTAASSFTFNSATQITATAPAGTGTVDVRVTTGGGTSATGPADQFTYLATPTVSSISPTAGPATGGASVTINGTNFAGVTAVTFGGTAASSFTFNSPTQITATAPAGTGTVDVRVTTGGGTSATSAADQFTYVAAPTVSSISPASGPATGGTSVTITGTNLSGATAVRFGAGNASGFTVNSATQITATAPAGTGTVDITVITGGGTSATSGADQFTYLAAPTVSSISPTAGPATGGSSVTITGTNFGGVTAVTFGGTAASSFTFNSATQITATAPAGTGTVDVRVTTGGGTSATGAADQFTYVAAPTVSSISPTSGPAAGGTSVTITGANLTGASAVRFGGGNASGFIVNSATQITATAPAGTGTVDITVITAGGTSATGAADQFTYVAAPTVSSISPAAGLATGGAIVSITGSNLTGATAVRFGASNAASFTVSSATQITATAPAGTGTVDVRVTTGGGTSATSGADQFTYVVPPTISVAPSVLPAITASTVYNQTISASGGVTPYSFAITSGTLPAGLTLAANGVLSGTPTAAGAYSFTVTATDSSASPGPYTASRAYSGTVAAPTIAITPGALTAVSVGTAYSQQLTSSGGSSPYAYTVTSGSLPAGITLSASGLLSGTPMAAGSFSFTVQAVDAHAFTGTKSYTLVVSPATLTLNLATLPNPVAETAYSATLTASGGTAPYTYSVSSGSLPAGLSLNTATGVLSGTTNVAGSFTFSLRAADSSTGVGAPFSVTSSYTVTVAAPTISITPATLPAATAATVYSQQLTASGGIGPYAYTVSTGSLPAGLTLNSSGLLSGTPTAGGSFTLTVQAADAHAFTGTQSYTLVVSSASVSLTPATLTNPTAEAAYSATLTAAGGTAPYTFSVSNGSLPAGLSLNAATGVLSGMTNVAGSFPFSIKVTDSSTGVGAPFSATNSYTLAVAAPVLSLTPSSLAAIRAGDAYSQTFTAAGGVAPYAYALSSGTLPTGLVLDAATGIVSGTPTVAGSFAFTLQARDAHLFTVQQALTLQVNQAPPPVPNETATTSSNQEVSLTIASTDGSPITDVTIVTPPQHGRVTVVASGAAGGGSGRAFKVTYVPNADYFGPDAFSYTATGPGGTSAPATVSLTVAPQPVPVPVAKTATVLAGTPVTLHVTEGATGGPFTAVAITTQPASGTATVSGMDIVYTPGINTSGDISIGYTVSNAFGTSAPVKASISVNPMPQVVSQSATVVAGLTVTVDLTAGATGGPFTAANVLSVAPAEAGKAVVRDVGTAGKPSYQLSFAASGKFAGAAVVSYTLSNAYATSKPGVVNVTVTARRDPSVDPEVIGLQAAQADAARRFASAQLSNFTQRLESLHGDGWGRSSFGLSLTPPNDSGNPTAALARWQEQEADRVFGTAVKPFMRKAALRQHDGGFSSDKTGGADVGQATSGLPDMPQKPDTQKQALSLWLGGAVDFGQHYVNGRDTGFRFRTNGVSVGGDYRLSDLATLGVGAGFSHDRSDVGQNGSRSTADSAVAAVYGSLRPSKGVFLDGVLGYGTLQYDASRYLTDGSGFATGERDGKQVFGAVVGGIEMRQETWMWSPYGRVELMSAKLDPYTEKAAGINALSYFKQTVRSRIGALGVRAEGIYVGGLGTWFPRARLEYRHQFQGADDARLAYADLVADGPVYVIRTVPQQTGNWAAGLGVKLLLSNGMTITLDYNSNLNIDSGRTQSVMFGIAMPLK